MDSQPDPRQHETGKPTWTPIVGRIAIGFAIVLALTLVYRLPLAGIIILSMGTEATLLFPLVRADYRTAKSRYRQAQCSAQEPDNTTSSRKSADD